MNKSLLLAAALLLSASLSGCSYLPSWLGGGKTPQAKLPGERITVLPPETALTADETIAALPVILPAPAENADGPQPSGNLALKGSLVDHSSAQAGEGDSFKHTLVPRPLVAGGSVFVMDAGGHISAHDAAHIETVRWNSEGMAEENAEGAIGGGLAFDQGKLYAVSGSGLAAAFDAATGKTLWRKSIHIPFRSAPKVADGKLFAITIDNQLFALDTATGDVSWNQRGIDETAGLMNSVSPAISNGTVIVPYSSGELYALSAADGREMWNSSLALATRTQAGAVFSGIGGDPVVDGEVVFAVSSGGLLSVLSLSQGQRVWERQISSINTPWIAGDFVYVLSLDNTLICFVKYTGKIRWATKLASFENEEKKTNPITWRGPVLVDGKLAIAGSRGQMALVSATDGKIVGNISIPEGVYTAPVVAGGRMYLLTQDATLYSLQ